MNEVREAEERHSSVAMSADEFRLLGHQTVNRVADFLESLARRPVTTGESPLQIRQALKAERTLPEEGSDPAMLLDHAADLLFEHSLSMATRVFGAT